MRRDKWILSIVMLGLVLLQTACYTGQYDGPISDHFNGLTFFYPKVLYPPCKPKSRDNNVAVSVPVKVTYINHATILIESRLGNIITDPIYSCRASFSQCVGPVRLHQPGIPFKRLPHIDIVLISHSHYDHLDIATLKRLDQAYHPVIIVPLGVKSLLACYGLTNVIELDWWQTYRYHEMVIHFFPAQHWSSRWFFDANGMLWGSYGINIGNKRIYFGGDSAYNCHFKVIHDYWGAPDLALLPIGHYEPHWYIKDVHMNPCESVHAHLDLGSKLTIGMHFETFPLTIEGPKTDLRDLYYARRAWHVSDKQFITLPFGGSRVLV